MSRPCQPVRPIEVVDAQIHLWQGPGAPAHHRQKPYLVDQALCDMEAARVDRAVVCPVTWDPTSLDYAVAASAAHPDRFATLGWVPLTSPDPDAVVQVMKRPGVLGLRFVVATPDVSPLFESDGLDWLWQVADEQQLPVGLFVHPGQLGVVADLAVRFPGVRLMIDHLGVLPFLQVPQALDHLDTLLDLSRHPNVAVKGTGVPTMATGPYPFAQTHDALRRTVDAFGPARVFWGTDITRMPCSWSRCVSLFTDELPWLAGYDLELVMGLALRQWIGWT